MQTFIQWAHTRPWHVLGLGDAESSWPGPNSQGGHGSRISLCKIQPRKVVRCPETDHVLGSSVGGGRRVYRNNLWQFPPQQSQFSDSDPRSIKVILEKNASLLLESPAPFTCKELICLISQEWGQKVKWNLKAKREREINLLFKTQTMLLNHGPLWEVIIGLNIVVLYIYRFGSLLA